MTARERLRINGYCAGFTPAEWVLLKPLIAEEAPETSLVEQARRDPEYVAKVLLGRGVCGLVLHTVPEFNDLPDSLWEIVCAGAQREFYTCALRKSTLSILDILAGEHDCGVIVVKGSANAVTYYEKESLRVSLDIDLIMEEPAIAQCFREHTEIPSEDAPPEAWFELPEFRIAGYPVEAHGYFAAPSRWGHYADLAEDSQALKGFSRLRRPGTEAAFTLALLHFMHHGGGFFFDLMDMKQIARAPEFDIARAAELWKEKDLVDLVLPGLAVADALIPLVSDEMWDDLYSGLRRRKRCETACSIRFLSSARFNKMRLDWCRSRIAKPSFPRRLFQRVLGSQEFTRKQTGLEPEKPLFWIYHILLLPLKRMILFWK